MKKNALLIFFALAMSGVLQASDFGSAAVSAGRSYSLEEMLTYALEDEYTALAEYEAIMEQYGSIRPYSNIAESEKTHIAYLETLYRNYGLSIPKVDALDYVVVPGSLPEAAETGVQAEISNIAMYDAFLNLDLPDDVAETFTFLRKASENHLGAFERQVARF